jgi:hypothetical protein
MNHPPATLWNDAHIEARWGKKSGFMSDLRARGQGPHFLRLSARTVRYRPEDVIAYEEAQRFATIAESMASTYEAPPKVDPSSSSSFENLFGSLPASPRPEPRYTRGPYRKKSHLLLLRSGETLGIAGDS